jgi:peptidoglycan/xylan/chitin deacetylase (PgdA/CDA1 family)/CelD/BcsL family acetyltransferase involved in cellulose biosynthesis
MRIVLHESWDEMQSLATDWNRLLGESGSDTIFLSWEWCRAWWNAYGGKRSLFVLTAWNDKELIGVAPFYSDVLRRWYGTWTHLQIIGAGSGDSDYLDCFTKRGMERQVVNGFLEFLESVPNLWDWIQIEGVPQNSLCLAALGEAAAEWGWSFTSSDDIVCAALSLPREWDDYLSLLRPRVRSKVRSTLANFQQLKLTPIECTAAGELDTWLSQLFQVHTSRWYRQNGPGVFRSESRRAFYREVSRTALEKGWLALHRLTWGERPLALQYGFRYHNRLYVLQEGYDPLFEKLRPGVALRGRIVQQEIERGLAEYDFLAGDARHKLDWGARRKVSRVVRLAKKPTAVAISMSIPAFSKSFHESTRKLVPETVRSWRARFIRSQRQRGWHDRPSRRTVTVKNTVLWSASQLHSKTPLGEFSRRLAAHCSWHGIGQGFIRFACSSTPVWTIFRYHRVNDDEDPFFNALPVAKFHAQMEYLARHFQFVSLDDLANGKIPPGKSRSRVAITFDDGYRDNFIHAFPILRKLKIPATIFLTTGYIESGQLPWYDQVRLAFKLTVQPNFSLRAYGGPSANLESEDRRVKAMQLTIAWLRTIDDGLRLACLPELFKDLRVPCDLNLPSTMLSWNEIRRMYREGVSFGAHTVTHPVLGNLPASLLQEEILGSKKTIEDRLQVPVLHFAYPFGKPADFSGAARQVVQTAGFKTAVTTMPGFNGPEQDRLELKRLSIEEPDPRTFGLKLDWSRMSSMHSMSEITA